MAAAGHLPVLKPWKARFVKHLTAVMHISVTDCNQLAIHRGFLEELSEQFILDCTPNPKSCGGTGGCMGGTGELAYNRLKELNGIPSEWTYPYIR